MAAKIALLLMLLFSATSLYASNDVTDTGTIRVGIYYNQTASTAITISGPGKWQAEGQTGDLEQNLQVIARNSKIIIKKNGSEYNVGSWMVFTPLQEDRWLEMDDWAYRGSLKATLQTDGKLKVVNTLPLEDYLKGVVANEMFFHPEAYKVQAVISRTFAIYVRDREKRHVEDGFDICATGHCQVYRGLDSEAPFANEAVVKTSGEVLTYHGCVIFSAYHSNAGGQTQEVDEAWPGSIRRNFPYLVAVPSPYDRTAQELSGYEWCYRWQQTRTGREITDRLAARGQGTGEIRDVLVLNKTRSGRVIGLEIIGSEGKVRVDNPAEVEAVLGTPSAWLEIKKNGQAFEINGWGHGHGVGLSQHGALGMARAGYSYEQILGHYYRNVALTKDYGRGESKTLSPPRLNLSSNR